MKVRIFMFEGLTCFGIFGWIEHYLVLCLILCYNSACPINKYVMIFHIHLIFVFFEKWIFAYVKLEGSLKKRFIIRLKLIVFLPAWSCHWKVQIIAYFIITSIKICKNVSSTNLWSCINFEITITNHWIWKSFS
jgi:hypothetical protein